MHPSNETNVASLTIMSCTNRTACVSDVYHCTDFWIGNDIVFTMCV